MNEKRKQLLKLLAQAGDLYPDMRFGQLVINLSHWALGPDVSSAWDITDQELIAELEKHLNDKQD